MTTEVRRRRGTTAQHASFAGGNAETTIDTDKRTVVVHDGSTAGGFPLAREDLTNIANAAFRQKYRSHVTEKTGDGPHAAVAADRGASWLMTGASPQIDLAEATALGNGWLLNVMARGGDVVVDPNGTEQIEGESTFTVKDGSDATIRCDGTAFHVMAGGAGVETPDSVSLMTPAYFTSTDGKSIGPGDVLTPATITSNQNNYAPTGLASATLVRLSSDAPRTITGIGTSGSRRQMTLVNVGSHPITLANQNASSTSGFRFGFADSIVLLPGSAVTVFYDGDAGRWRRADPGSGVVVGRAYGEYTANADLTTVVPVDDTIPQNNEGTQIISVNYTPKYADSRIRLTFSGAIARDTVGNIAVAFFRNSVANAVASKLVTTAVATAPVSVELVKEITPGVTTLETYSVRIGAASGGASTVRLNGTTSARLFGGTMAATLVVEEIRP